MAAKCETTVKDNQNKFIELRERIKDFTKQVPSDKGQLDYSYKVYLGKAARLCEIDDSLSDSVNFDLTPEEMAETLKGIECDIDEILR